VTPELLGQIVDAVESPGDDEARVVIAIAKRFGMDRSINCGCALDAGWACGPGPMTKAIQDDDVSVEELSSATLSPARERRRAEARTAAREDRLHVEGSHPRPR
jgi:hypothetical protein